MPVTFFLVLIMHSAPALAAPISQRFLHLPAVAALLFHASLVGAPGSEDEEKFSSSKRNPRQAWGDDSGGGGHGSDEEIAYGSSGGFGGRGGGVVEDRAGAQFPQLPMAMEGSGVRGFGTGSPFQGLYTGVMGCCVSFVLLWDYDAARSRYGSMRGIHSLGGAERLEILPAHAALGTASDPDGAAMTLALFREVHIPNVNSTRMIAVSAELEAEGSSYAPQREHVRVLHRTYLPNAELQIFRMSSATVHRDGRVVTGAPGDAPPHNASRPGAFSCGCVIL